MKGFFIQVTNNLLDPKHRNAIGPAVWEFMWFLDKITRIDEDGTGWVLGGKPINIADLTEELGGGDRQTRENVSRLEAAGYIRKQRTPGGIRIWVFKAKKRFGRSDRQKTADRSAENRRSNIRHYKDSKQRKALTSSIASSRPNAARLMDRVRVDEEGNEMGGKRGGGAKREGLNKVALRIRRKFGELAQQKLGASPVEDVKSYQIILFAMKKGKLDEKQIYDLFEEWFGLPKPDEELISITRALSGRQIEAYKVRNGIS